MSKQLSHLKNHDDSVNFRVKLLELGETPASAL
jgi:hypothetical protein